MEDEGGGRTSEHGSILQMTDHVFSGFSTNTYTHTNTNTSTNTNTDTDKNTDTNTDRNTNTKQKYKHVPVYTDLLSK